jgi:hypothetical protein
MKPENPDATTPPTETEIADVLSAAGLLGLTAVVNTVCKLAFERDRFKTGLKVIATHSVCCDARHLADKLLAGESVNVDSESKKY